MVNSKTLIDTEFDFRQEVGGKDPDTYSPTLKQYHQILWNKPLPNGKLLQISHIKSKYLVGICEDVSIELSSDSIINSLSFSATLYELNFSNPRSLFILRIASW